MTRDQHLEFCKRCKNRIFHAQQGIICNLTGHIADFDPACSNFALDETVKIEVPPTESIPNHELVKELPSDAKELLRTQQDSVYAIIGGIAAAILGGLIWATITVATQYQIGYMAIGVGLLVGFAVRYFGSGIDQHFGFIGAFFALAGCALGNLLSQVGFIAEAESLGYFETLTLLDLSLILNIYKESFSPMDLFFYGIAAYEGYKFAFRTITEEELQLAKKGKLEVPPFNRYRLIAVCIVFVILMVSGYYVSRGAVGPKTFYYESGSKRSTGELNGGLENGLWNYWWESGNLQYTGYFLNGKQDSIWKFYDEDGALYREGSFDNGLQQGKWIDYHASGKISSEGNYSDGRQQNEWAYFYEDGTLSQKGSYYLGNPDGVWEYYHPTGKLSSKGSYKDGEEIGAWNYWSDTGSKLQELEFTDAGIARVINAWDNNGRQEVSEGNGLVKNRYEEGTVSETGKVKDGYRTSRWVRYFQSGSKQEEGEYVKGEYKLINSWSYDGKPMVINGEGIYTSYYDEEGTVLEKGLIQNGLREGIWKMNSMFSSNVFTETTYSEGKASGVQKSFFEDGQVSVEGTMVDNKRSGEWKWYFESGVLESTVQFVNGLKEGMQQFFNENGDLLRTEIYKKGRLENTHKEPL